MDPIKVLYIYGDTLRLGGIEKFMLNYFRNIDRSVVHIDFLLQGDEEGVYDREILEAGAKIFRLPKPGKHLHQFKKGLAQILKTGEYKVIHAHCDAMNCRVLRIAQRCGVPVRISHSHNTKHILNYKVKFFFYEHCRKQVHRYATECWACSTAAGAWLYGHRPFRVVPNAIYLKQYAFDPELRCRLRAQYGIAKDEIVLGNVGRFHEQKNHSFMVKLMEALKTSSRQYRLVLVGGGELEEQIRQQAFECGVQQQILFVGAKENAERYYHMMDLFLLPSLFEGYPLVISEAEANGLFCLASEYVPREVEVGNRVMFLALKTELWKAYIEGLHSFQRQDVSAQLVEKGMEIFSSAEQVQEAYLQLYRQAIGK